MVFCFTPDTILTVPFFFQMEQGFCAASISDISATPDKSAVTPSVSGVKRKKTSQPVLDLSAIESALATSEKNQHDLIGQVTELRRTITNTTALSRNLTAEMKVIRGDLEDIDYIESLPEDEREEWIEYLQFKRGSLLAEMKKARTEKRI